MYIYENTHVMQVKRYSQHRAGPGIHDSVHSHSCGLSMSSHLLQGLLPLTQDWDSVEDKTLQKNLRNSIHFSNCETFS